MSYKQLKVEQKGQLLFVTVSRPEAMNALNSTFFDEMNLCLDNEAAKEDISVVIITGEGKAFVAGADIAEMVNMDSEEGTAFSVYGQSTFNKIENLDKPVIAAVNGFALGGGLELAMACDFRIASAKAKFGQPEVNLGLIPGYAGTQRLSRLTNLADALYLLMTADMINAEDALRINLVQKVVEPEALMEEVEKIGNNIAAKGPSAVKKVKHVTRTGFNNTFEIGGKMESEHFGSLFGNEGTVGMKAFLEKRKPDWN
jgi:enoyl-CoA hydratase